MARKTLICLNSEQVIANVIALGEVKPDRLVVISTEDMVGQFKNLCACVREMGISPPEKAIMVPPWDFEEIGRILDQQLPEMAADERVILNATGGTKPMALVALERLRSHPGFEALYIDSRNNLKYLFFPGPAAKASLSYAPPIPLYLRAYGLHSSHVISEPWLEEASSFVSRHFESLSGLIWRIKSAWAQGSGTMRISKVRALDPRSAWHRFLALLRDRQIIKGFSLRQGEVLEILWQKQKEAYRYFVQCGWLEHLTYFSLKDLADEICMNLSVFQTKEPNASALAEYDVVARRGATLFFFECKSGSTVVDGSQLGQAVQSFQAKVKLSGGVMAKPVFVLSNRFKQPTDLQIERARFAGVKIIGYDDIAGRLTETLEAILLPFQTAT
ncbi:MAG: DUF1887 family protein [Deltaproteobacteria bacterium]|nr:DUF1887 family protein [Deltaproteobacteria bacterium]